MPAPLPSPGHFKKTLSRNSRLLINNPHQKPPPKSVHSHQPIITLETNRMTRLLVSGNQPSLYTLSKYGSCHACYTQSISTRDVKGVSCDLNIVALLMPYKHQPSFLRGPIDDTHFQETRSPPPPTICGCLTSASSAKRQTKLCLSLPVV